MGEMIHDLCTIIVGMIVVIYLLCIIIIPFLYLALYLKDILFANYYYSFLKSPKCFQLKRILEKYCSEKLATRISRFPTEPKATYLRYNTPLISFGFSFIVIGIFWGSSIFVKGTLKAFFVGCIIYVLCYCIGMYRKLGKWDEQFEKAVKSSQEYLKLSFMPIAFIITMVGFALSVSDRIDILNTLTVSMHDIKELYYGFMRTGGAFHRVQDFIISVIQATLILYVFSLPVQVIAYFGIQVTCYMRSYGAPYCHLIKRGVSYTVRLLRKMWR